MNFHEKNTFTVSPLLNIYEKYLTNKTVKKLNEAKHYLPSNKEWLNSAYLYDYHNMVNLPVKDKLLYDLLKSYFNMKKNKLKNFNFANSFNDVTFSSFKKKKSNYKSLLSLIKKAKEKKNNSLRNTLALLFIYKKTLHKNNVTTNNFNEKNNHLLEVEKKTYLKKLKKNRNIFYVIAKRRLIGLRKKNIKTKLKRTYLSIPDLKHYNNKSIITVCLYNRDKIYLKKKVYKYYKLFILKSQSNILNKDKHPLNNIISESSQKDIKLNTLRNNILNKIYLLSRKKSSTITNILSKSCYLQELYRDIFYRNVFKKLNMFFIVQNKNNMNDNMVLQETQITNNYFDKYSLLLNIFDDKKLNLNSFRKANQDKSYKVNRLLKKKLIKLKNRLLVRYKKILTYKYYILNLCFMKFRLNNSNLLGLKNIIRKIYNKKIILKIINLKYMYLDSNIVNEAITRRLKDRKKRILKILKKIIRKIKRVSIVKGIWLESLNLNIDVSWNNDENNLLNIYKLYNIRPANLVWYKDFLMRSKENIRSLILYNINNKTISGIKMQGAGRLTKRLTASRSITKFRSKGSLKNINSSFHSISTIMLRGYFKSNLQYININSYNRNGSFGMKTWISSY